MHPASVVPCNRRRATDPNACLCCVVAALVALLITTVANVAVAISSDADRGFETRSALLWAPFEAWTVAAAGVPGNPFDAVATVTFTHQATGEHRTSEMFYVGDERWEFRFTGTRLGTWRFASFSAHAALDGWHGSIDVAQNPDPSVRGFLTATGTRFAEPTSEGGTVTTRLYNVYMNHELKNSLHEYSLDEEAREAEVAEMLDAVEAHGLDAVFVAVNNNWFQFGVDSHRDHDQEDPSLDSFAVLETLIVRAHQRGLSVHVWKWGDEDRAWTPIGVGGINGVPDRRLQRYIAARLGPVPGWTMSYGFDLHEWVTPEEVRSWWSYMHQHLGWPRLLMARESRAGREDPRDQFDLGQEKLDVHSSDERPEEDFLESATALFEKAHTPLLFERRFLHTRDRVWDMETTRRALWQFTLAGGAGAIWGTLWDDGPPYPKPYQLQTHGSFWSERFTDDLTRAERTDGVGTAITLWNHVRTRAVFYAEATGSVRIDLSGAATPLRAVAVDTAAPYREIDLGRLPSEDQVWAAPHRSDWAVAVGDF
jgi:hypothetical protein